MNKMDLKDFMKQGRICSAKQVDGRGDDRSFLVMLDFGGTAQGFTGFYFGEGSEALAKLDLFCSDLASTFGVRQFENLEGREAVALYDQRLLGKFSSGCIVGLMNPENGKKFIAAEWFEKNYGVKYESPLETKRAGLLADRAALHRRQAEINWQLDNLENNVYEWRS